MQGEFAFDIDEVGPEPFRVAAPGEQGFIRLAGFIGDFAGRDEGMWLGIGADWRRDARLGRHVPRRRKIIFG